MRTELHGFTSAKVTAKQRLLGDLIEGREHLLSAIRGLSEADVERPIADGKWSVREIVLHLCFWEYETREAVDTALRGVAPRWDDNGPADDAKLNAEGHVRFGKLAWDRALEVLRGGRTSLLAALERVPDEPADLWTSSHVFGRMLLDMPEHEKHHADQIRRFRAGLNL